MAKIKAKAPVIVFQSREQVQTAIYEIGVMSRERARLVSKLNDAIAKLTSDAQPSLESLSAKVQAQVRAVRDWCDANRAELTQNGKTKTVDLGTGTVAWRLRPPSVKLTGEAQVMEALLSDPTFAQFLRTTHAVDKQAMLADPEAAKQISGVTILTHLVDFSVEPFENAGAEVQA
jgi:phage host-nuclease inhibitor protein Gam